MIIFSATMIFSLLIVVLMYGLMARVEERHNTIERVNRFDGMRLLSTDSVPFEVLPGKHTFCIYFNPDCDHCQNQAQEIVKNADAFSETLVVWFGAAPLKQMASFARTHELRAFDNFLIGKMDAETISERFGTLHVPHTFLYDSQGKLTHEFRGEQRAIDLLKHLPR